jgi:hypothetical protein
LFLSRFSPYCHLTVSVYTYPWRLVLCDGLLMEFCLGFGLAIHSFLDLSRLCLPVILSGILFCVWRRIFFCSRSCSSPSSPLWESWLPGRFFDLQMVPAFRGALSSSPVLSILVLCLCIHLASYPILTVHLVCLIRSLGIFSTISVCLCGLTRLSCLATFFHHTVFLWGEMWFPLV